MKIALFTTDTLFGKYLMHSLYDLYSFEFICIDQHIRSKKDSFFRKFLSTERYNSLCQAVKSIANPLERQIMQYEKKSIKDKNNFLKDKIKKHKTKIKCPIQKVPNINDKKVLSMMEAYKPDVVIIYGTELLKQDLLEQDVLYINAHPTYLPNARGAKPEFFLCYHNMYNNMGVTLHKVNSHIDAGDIILQKKLFISKEENYINLQKKTNETIVQLYTQLYFLLTNNQLTYKKQPSLTENKLFLYKDYTVEKRLEYWKKFYEQK